MAAQYDPLGNYLGDWETEEERKKREEELANTPVATQEIKTYGDGTVERTTTEEYAPAIQPVAVRPVQQMPVAQPVARPVSPETFQRMIQVESGGRDFTPQGQPLTSPKGAMFSAQVMPATAANPGFGIRPAQAQTPEEFNRVGRELYQKLLEQYGGDEQKAAAAYNAGFGRVNQNLARNQGQLNVAELPKETQGYLQKVFRGVGNVVEGMIPSAQAGTLPQREAGAGRGTFGMPQVTPGPGVAVATGRGVQGTMEVPEQPISPEQLAAQPAPQAQPQPAAQPAANPLLAMQDDPIQMLAAVKDPATSEADKKWLGETLRDKYLMDINMTNAKDQTKTLVTKAVGGDRKAANTIAKELQNPEGSWIKMILLGFISPQLAGEEAIKLGFGNKWVQGNDENGNPAMIQVNAKGLPLKGYDKEGNELAPEQLVGYTTGAGAGKTKADVSTQDVERNGVAGRVITQHLPNGKTRTMVESGGKLFEYDTSWKPRSISAAAAKADYGLITDLKKKHGANVLDAEKDYVTLNGPFKSPEERQQFRQIYGYGEALPGAAGAPAGTPAVQTAPAAGAVTQPPAGQVAGPVAAPGAAAGGGEVRKVPQTVAPPAATQPSNLTRPLQEQKTAADAAKTKAKEEAEIAGKDIGTIRANQGRSEAGADYLITKVDELFADEKAFRDSVGIKGGGLLYGALKEPIAGTKEADWMARFKEVQGQSFLQAIENLRGMGALSNQEGENATKAIQRMSQSQSEDEFRKAAEDFQNIIRRGIDRNRIKLGQEPKYGTKPESEMAADRKETPMSPAEKARAELEERRRRKEKK